MVILAGYQVMNRLANAEVAFIGRLTTVTPTLSVCSTPPVNHYTLKFENELRPLKGSISTIYEFHYQQILNINQTLDRTFNLQATEPGQLYVGILHADGNTIEILIEITENDLPLLQPLTNNVAILLK